MVGSQASVTGHGALLSSPCCSGIEHLSELSFQLKLKEDILDRPLPITDGICAWLTRTRRQVDADLLRSAAVD